MLKRVRSRLWYGRLRIEDGAKIETLPLGVTDKRVAQHKLNAIAKHRQMVAVGLAVPETHQKAMWKRLPELINEFLEDLRAKGRAHGTVKRYRNLLRTMCTGCGWHHLKDVNPARFCAWRASASFKPHYANDILGAALALLNWLERQGFEGFNSLRRVGKVQDDNVGEYRRALSADEVTRLLKVAPASRAWVYLVIVYTGLRRYELNRLNWGHFHFEAAEPFVELQAKNTKARRAASLPLRPEVVAALRSQMPENVMPFEWVFRGKVPTPQKLRKDLAAAGVPVVDERGRRVDVHALRTTFGTMLSVAGVPPRVAMELMRHSDLKLTMRVYTDSAQLPLAQDVQRLPSFSVADANAQQNAQISAQTVVADGVSESQPVANERELASQQLAEVVPFSPAESSPVATGQNLKMVGAVRFELIASLP